MKSRYKFIAILDKSFKNLFISIDRDRSRVPPPEAKDFGNKLKGSLQSQFHPRWIIHQREVPRLRKSSYLKKRRSSYHDTLCPYRIESLQKYFEDRADGFIGHHTSSKSIGINYSLLVKHICIFPVAKHHLFILN